MISKGNVYTYVNFCAWQKKLTKCKENFLNYLQKDKLALESKCLKNCSRF